jgi:DNA adenine methylase
MPRTYSPLRYPGGKTALAPTLKQLFVLNGMLDGHYVEPYAGGCGLALNLLFTIHASHIHLNDLDPAIYNFWKIALENSQELCNLIDKTEVTMEQWFRQKTIYSQPIVQDPLAHAYATLFLNRTNRSGILLGGVIGGKNQNGNYKLDARFNKCELVNKLIRIHNHRHRIHLYNKDAKDFLVQDVPTFPKKTIIYLDPPYYVKGGNLYQNHYKPADHAAIAEVVNNLNNRHWLVSYDCVPTIESLYKDVRKWHYSLSYSAKNHFKGTEVMFFSDDMILPDDIASNNTVIGASAL